MYEKDNLHWGLVHAFVLDGRGGARSLEWEQLEGLQLTEQESLWLHWDRGHPQTHGWLREHSGLSDFSCDLLLEENTRPRLLTLPEHELLLFLRGVNLNPGAEPEDMVSVRIFADARRVISLRQRPLRATEELIALLEKGQGPRDGAELVLQLAHHLTDRVDGLIEEFQSLGAVAFFDFRHLGGVELGDDLLHDALAALVFVLVIDFEPVGRRRGQFLGGRHLRLRGALAGGLLAVAVAVFVLGLGCGLCRAARLGRGGQALEEFGVLAKGLGHVGKCLFNAHFVLSMEC